MTPRQRNEIANEVFSELTVEDYFLGFKYNGMKQTGSCNCSNTGFLRIPKFTVVHKTDVTVLTFKTHHGDNEVIRVGFIDNEELQTVTFKTELYNKVKLQLDKYASDWD